MEPKKPAVPNALPVDTFFEENFLTITQAPGMWFSPKRIYKPSAATHLTLFSHKKAPPNSVLHFFCWDTHFASIEPDRFRHTIEDRRCLGIVQTDFSAWYFQDANRKLAIRKNFQNMDTARRMGHKVLLNFNNIHSDFFHEYRRILPANLGTVCFDLNHNEDKYAVIYTKNWRAFLAYFNPASIICITNKTKVSKPFQGIFTMIAARHIPVFFLPTEMSVLKARMDIALNNGVKG